MLFRSDRKSTRLNSSHTLISYAVFCLKKKKKTHRRGGPREDRRQDTLGRRPRGAPARRGGSPHVFLCFSTLCSLSRFFFFFLNNRAPPEFHPLPLPRPLPT